MSIISFVLVAGLVIVALLIRNNLLALCMEVLIVVVLFIFGIGSTWFLVVMLLVLAVLFFTNSDVPEGVLKCLIFFVQTCSLVLANLFDWGFNSMFDSFVIQRNGLECLIPWYNVVVRFWLLMSLPVGIVLLCIVIYHLGRCLNYHLKHSPSLDTTVENENDSSEKSLLSIKNESDRDSAPFYQYHDEKKREFQRHLTTTFQYHWLHRCFSICLFLWYIVYYEISASVSPS